MENTYKKSKSPWFRAFGGLAVGALLLVWLVQCSNSSGSKAGATFNVNSTGGGLNMVKTNDLNAFLAKNKSQTMLADYVTFGVNIPDYITDQFKQWVKYNEQQNPTNKMLYYCSYGTAFTGVPDNLQKCSTIDPKLFNSATGTFTWQPYIKNGDYEFWLTARFQNKDVVTFHFDITVNLLKVAVLSLDSTWVTEPNPTVDLESAETAPLDDSGQVVIVATAMFDNSNPSILAAGSSPVVDFTSLDVATLQQVLLHMGFDKSMLYNNGDTSSPLAKSDLIALLPKMHMVVYSNSVYVGAELSKIQFINFAQTNSFQSLSTDQKNALDISIVHQLRPDIAKIKAYMELIWAAHLGGGVLNLPEPAGFPGVSKLVCVWQKLAR